MEKMHYPSRRRRKPALFGLLFLAFIFIIGAVVQYLWNAILPEVLHVGMLGYWQALGLLLLCRILFGSFRFGPPRRGKFRKKRFRQHLMNMTPEQREALRARWKQRYDRERK